jgi:LAO/AO transport system kinase
LGGRGLAERIIAGDEKSAARLITLIEDGSEEGYRELSRLFTHTGKAHIIGITGPPGAGKSTVTGGLAVAFAGEGKKVGVVAVDPTSIVGGGALLADRLRMKGAEKQGIFIRSMAHRGHPGGLARAAAGAVYVLEALGKDAVLVESMGAGQAEKALSYLCDTVVILFTPAYGDEVQLLKAGLLEIGDIVVVNKTDLAGAESAKGVIASMVAPGPDGWTPPVLGMRADRGEGIAELAGQIERHWRFLTEDERREKRRRERTAAFTMDLLKEKMWEAAAEAVRKNKGCMEIAREAIDRKRDPYDAVERIVKKTALRIKA